MSAPVVAAAETTYQGQYVMTIGFTDNAFSAPENPPAGVQGPQENVFAVIGPGVLVRRIEPRSQQELSYRFTTQIYQEDPGAASFQHRLGWDGSFNTSHDTSVMAGASAATGRVTAFDITLTEAGSARPPISEDYVTAGARETVLHEFKPPWRMEQQSTAAFRHSLEDPSVTPTTVEVMTALTGEHVGVSDAKALTLRLVGARAWAGAGQDPDIYDRNGARAALMARYRRDLNINWSSELRLGGEQLLIGDDIPPPTVSAGAALRYFFDEGLFETAATREVRTDVFFGTQYVAEEASVLARTPRRWLPEKVSIYARAAGMRVHLIDDGSGLDTRATYILAGAGVVSWETSDYVTLEGGYVVHVQRGAEDLRDYMRQAATVTLTVNYPARDRHDPPREPALRVDGSDQPTPDRRQ
ncbi:MAG TPA: hypothetical protein VMZ28_14570 [Kofleriaceae bacterium]|nr:hypothetical protein [Kofleriaceae bacterium]